MDADVTADLIDQISFITAIVVTVVAYIVRRLWRRQDSGQLQILSDIFNGAAIVPLLALIAGLFFKDVRQVVIESHGLLIALSSLVALGAVLRLIFGQNGATSDGRISTAHIGSSGTRAPEQNSEP